MAPRRDTPRSDRGATLVEILMVVLVMGIVAVMGVPRLGTAFEGARVDEAGAVLRSIWNAQRSYHIEHREYAVDLDLLVTDRLLDGVVLTASAPFAFALTAAGAESFTVEATRAGSDVWSGSLAIDESGDITGQIEDGDGASVEPYQG